MVLEGRLLAELSARVGIAADDLALPDEPLAGVAVPGPGTARSDVLAADSAAAASADLRRERAGRLPAVALGLFVEEEGTELRAGPSLAVTLPVWRANVDGRAEAVSALAVARSERDATERRAEAEQATAERASMALEAALADQGEDIPAEARAALDSVVLGYDRGELDLLSASHLQAEILAGHSAWLEGRRVVADARLDRLLAEEDERLLGGEGSTGRGAAPSP